jgi:putative PEP-CTERM system histidine kinase
MNLPAVTCLVAAIFALVLAIGVIMVRPRSAAQWSLLVGIILLGLESFCHFASLDSLHDKQRMIFWETAAFIPIALLPVIWLVFSLTFARGNASEFLQKWKLPVFVLAVVPLVVTIALWDELILDAKWTTNVGNWIFETGSGGKIIHGVMVVGSALILMNIESTFHAAIGTSRWKIKYAVLGITLLFGTRIYSGSQIILYSGKSIQLLVINASAFMLACVLLTVSLFRSRVTHVDIYPSSAVLHKSISVLLAGAFLMIVGLLAKVVEPMSDAGFPIKALIILAALVGLGILWFSDKVRESIKRFVSRHFKRPSHDYRKIWLTFTQRTVSVLDRQTFARAVATLISETFEVLSVTLWLADRKSGKLSFAASTSLEVNPDATPVSEEVLTELLALKTTSDPVNIDRSQTRWCELLRQSNPTFFAKGGNRLCVPLLSGGEVGGLIVLGDRVNGTPFSPEDLELLKCLGDQIAAALWNLSQSEKLVQAKEMEAFQAMSAFLVHDLKNTASALSLTLKNLPVHFENPAFREDALRTVSKSVERVNDLIFRLTAIRQKLEVKKSPADLNAVVTYAVGNLTKAGENRVSCKKEAMPEVPIDTRQIESVVTNLVLNARDALPAANGRIEVETSRQNGWAVLTVSDNGCGMSPEFISKSLFTPFRTSKKNGMGIGMFHSKAIVEAHGGRISVQSEPGKGTTFRVWLPFAE